MTLTPQEADRLVAQCHTRPADGRRKVVLFPDDIITLKLLKDEYAQFLLEHRRMYLPNSQLILETLERILKQLG